MFSKTAEVSVTVLGYSIHWRDSVASQSQGKKILETQRECHELSQILETWFQIKLILILLRLRGGT